MKILILGHTGMLGDAVKRYFEKQQYEIAVLPAGTRWPSPQMEALIKASDASWIINCIGAIPQRRPQDHEYFDLNTRLPLFLAGLSSKKILHAATDCEFSGKIGAEGFYNEDDYLDATDVYGLSKAIAAEFISKSNQPNVKMIRASIVGIEKASNASLLNWFLAATSKGESVTGFNNHYWNGITTLEWAKVAEMIITGKYEGTIFQMATQKLSKYELLKAMATVFRPGYDIKEASHPKYQNKCLATRWEIRDINNLLAELKEFYQL